MPNAYLSQRFATRDYPEQTGGILLCGINWGGRDDDAMAALVKRRQSFFSDEAAGTYRYKERILRWFEWWGRPLQTDAVKAGALELSISQANWLAERSARTEHRSQSAYLIAHLDEFLTVAEAKRPRLIFFLGTCLGLALERALRSPSLRARIESTLGECREIRSPVVKDIPGKKKRAKLHRLRFARTLILTFPHPTGAFGITNEEIACFGPEVRAALAECGHGA